MKTQEQAAGNGRREPTRDPVLDTASRQRFQAAAAADAERPDLAGPGHLAAPWCGQYAYIALALIVLAGFVLRCIGFDTRDFWVDEATRVSYAKLPWPIFISVMLGGHEPNPPVYFLVLGSVISLFGDSLASYRLLALIGGIGTIIAAYYLAKDVYNPLIGLLTALLVAVSPYFIAYAQDASPYSLLGFFSTLSLWRFFVALRDETRRSWFIYALVTAAAIYLHYYALLVVAWQGAYLLLAYTWPRKRLPRHWAIAVLTGGLLCLAHLPVTVIQAGSASSLGYTGRSVAGYVQTLATNTFNLGNGYRVSEFSELASIGLLNNLPQLIEFLAVASIPALLALTGACSALRNRGHGHGYPLFIFAGVSLSGAYTIFLARHLIVVAVLYFVLIAIAIGYRRRAVGLALLGLIFVVDVVSLSHFYSTAWSRTRPEDWAGAAQRVVSGARAGDVVALRAWLGGAFAFTHRVWSLDPNMVLPAGDGQLARFSGPIPASWEFMSPLAILGKVVYSWQVTPDRRLVETTEPDLVAGEVEADRLLAMLCSGCRLWLIYDQGDAQGWPRGLERLSEEMSAMEVEHRSPYLRLMVLERLPRSRHGTAGLGAQ